MKPERAQLIVENMDHYVHHDRIFLNNPAVMQGMGLAPLVIAATTGHYALMLFVALCMLLIPTRVVCSLALRRVEHPLLRVIGYCVVAAGIYVLARMAMSALFDNEALELGIYLPLLVVDPIVIYRHGRVPESVSNAASKGARIMLGYGLVLMLTGCARELAALGTLFGYHVLPGILMPLASQPAGGFIILGVLFAVWRGVCTWYRNYVQEEARREA